MKYSHVRLYSQTDIPINNKEERPRPYIYI
jgi:hypothetical protein